ncbi:SpoIIE family protein phosphatase [bacterium]
MFKKLSTKISIFTIVCISIIIVIFSIYLVNNRTRNLHATILQKGIASAHTGKTMMEFILKSVVDNGIFPEEELFKQTLVPVSLSDEVIKKYKDISIDDLKKIQKFNYKNKFDSYLDKTIIKVQEEFLNDPQVVFAVLVDNQGYLPTHNVKYSKSLTGDFIFDRDNNRTKRIFNDPVGIKAAQNDAEAFLKQVYKRDTGEVMWDISAPVFLNGKKWGAFRIGFSMQKTYKQIHALRLKLILFMLALLLITIIVIKTVTSHFIKPLSKLHESVNKLAQGDFAIKTEISTNDEIGGVAKAFNKMVDEIQQYIQKLTKTTQQKERIESELDIAHNIQQDLIPKIFPPFPHRDEFDIFAFLKPTKQVGGDFYDFFFIDDNNICLVVGDVSDKGVPASLFMAVTKTLIKSTAKDLKSPKKILEKVNGELSLNNDSCMFVTVFFGILDIQTGELVYSNAGHNPPVIIKSDKSVGFLEMNNNTVLGVLQGAVFTEERTSLSVRDCILMYTDGVTEAVDHEDELYDEERLLNCIKEKGVDSAKDIVQTIYKDVQKFSENADQADDITIMSVIYKGTKK